MTDCSVTLDPRQLDDVVAVRDEAGRISVRFSSWLHPGQRLVLLGWLGALLNAQPPTALMLRMSAGRVVGQTVTLAGAELAELMDRSELSAAERARAVELICAAR